MRQSERSICGDAYLMQLIRDDGDAIDLIWPAGSPIAGRFCPTAQSPIGNDLSTSTPGSH
jgi:hypothetical protein